MLTSLETLGGDVLLEIVSWLSRLNLLNLLMTVRSSLLAPDFCLKCLESFSDAFVLLTV